MSTFVVYGELHRTLKPCGQPERWLVGDNQWNSTGWSKDRTVDVLDVHKPNNGHRWSSRMRGS